MNFRVSFLIPLFLIVSACNNADQSRKNKLPEVSCDEKKIWDNHSNFWNGFENLRPTDPKALQTPVLYSTIDGNSLITKTIKLEKTNINSENVDELFNELASGKSFPHGTPGYMNYSLQWSFKDSSPYDLSGSKGVKFKKGSLSATLTPTIYLPNWTNQKLNESVWNRYICELAVHEREHLQLTWNKSKEALVASANLRAKTKSELDKKWHKLWKQTLVDITAINQLFDAKVEREKPF